MSPSCISSIYFFPPGIPGQIIMFEFMNKIMVEVYKVLFDEKVPRVLDEMKSTLQPSTESCSGDWFLYKELIVVRVYRYTGPPYKLPTFMTPRIFALEFIRQRLCSKEEHFGAFKKSTDVKFPFKIDPFIFKNKATLNIVENLLEAMEFHKMKRLNYDPRQIILQRRQQNKNKAFEHQSMEGMDKLVNLLEFEEGCEGVKEEIIEVGEKEGNDLAIIV